MKILYVDSTVRDGSRTAALAKYLLGKLNGVVEEVKLSSIDFPAVDEDFLRMRDKASSERNFDSPVFTLAKQFAAADIVVVAAPFWDLSFPSALKQYFEQINVLGLTFEYTPEGIPHGLCSAKRLYYVTTAGGKIFSEEYGFGYVKALAEGFYGIRDCVMFKAEELDIFGSDTDKIMSDARTAIDRELK